MIQQNISLKKYNTFGLDVTAKQFITIHNVDELKKAIQIFPTKDFFVLGGGSNMLLTNDIAIPVLQLNLKGLRVIKQTDDYVWVEAAASEVWHNFVIWTIEHNFGGLENLSLIPGHVGTTPVQNIGAYGVEIKDTMISCKALNINTLEIKEFSNEDCQFGYRESIFKKELKNQYIILSVIFKLTKQNHVLHTDYGVILNELEKQHIVTPTIKDVSTAVISIRNSKLPDPAKIGNSGSFFKNPIVSTIAFEKIQKSYPNIPHYIINENEVKIPAGWLIETTGFKGYRIGDAGVHNKQALVLVNYGNAKGIEIKKLSESIQKEVFNIFNIHLEAEVNIF